MKCDKQPYDSRGAAGRAIAELKRHTHNRHQYTVYDCPYCEKYHIATTTKTLKRDKPLKYKLRKEDFIKPKRK
jgi:hypothetical protein